MTQAPIMPLHMRRDRFAPVEELRELREGEGVRRFESPFGANVWIVTRYADVREVLGDATRFSNRMAFRPPSDPRSEEEREQGTRRPAAGVRPAGAHAAAAPADAGVHRAPDAAAGAADRRDRRRSTSTRWRPRAARPTSCRRSRCRSRRW